MPRPKADLEAAKLFARSLNSLMELKNINAATLSRLVKVDQASMSHYINGKALPSSTNLHALAQYFGVGMEELLTGEVPLGGDGPPGPDLIENRLLEIDKRVGGIARIFHERTAELAENNKARIDDLSRRLDTAVTSASNRLDELGRRQNENLQFYTEVFRAVVTVLTELHPGERDKRRLAPLTDMAQWMRRRKAGGGK